MSFLLTLLRVSGVFLALKIGLLLVSYISVFSLQLLAYSSYLGLFGPVLAIGVAVFERGLLWAAIGLLTWRYFEIKWQKIVAAISMICLYHLLPIFVIPSYHLASIGGQSLEYSFFLWLVCGYIAAPHYKKLLDVSRKRWLEAVGIVLVLGIVLQFVSGEWSISPYVKKQASIAGLDLQKSKRFESDVDYFPETRQLLGLFNRRESYDILMKALLFRIKRGERGAEIDELLDRTTAASDTRDYAMHECELVYARYLLGKDSIERIANAAQSIPSLICYVRPLPSLGPWEHLFVKELLDGDKPEQAIAMVEKFPRHTVTQAYLQIIRYVLQKQREDLFPKVFDTYVAALRHPDCRDGWDGVWLLEALLAFEKYPLAMEVLTIMGDRKFYYSQGMYAEFANYLSRVSERNKEEALRAAKATLKTECVGLPGDPFKDLRHELMRRYWYYSLSPNEKQEMESVCAK